MDNYKNGFFILLSLAVVIVSSIFAKISSFKDDKPTCDKYILNTYLYLIVSLSLVVFFILVLNTLMPNYTNTIYASYLIFIVIILELVLLFYTIYLINKISPLDVTKKRLAWGAFILLFAFVLLPVIQMAIQTNQTDLVVSTMFLTLAIVGVLTFITLIKPDLIIKSTAGWTPYIIIGLICLILAHIIPMIFCLFANCSELFLNKFYFYLAVIGVIFFIFIILYKTKLVVENAEKCKTPQDADYIKESTNLFVSIINLFLNLLRSRSRGRL
jgi:FtsH-binding integral membrane protein